MCNEKFHVVLCLPLAPDPVDATARYVMKCVCALQVLGIDCEWVSNDQSQRDVKPGRRPVSLLQLASVSGVCVLVRLHLLQCIPDSLQQLLVDRR